VGGELTGEDAEDENK